MKKQNRKKSKATPFVPKIAKAITPFQQGQNDALYDQILKGKRPPVPITGMDQELADWIAGLSPEQIEERLELMLYWYNQLKAHISGGTAPHNRINLN